MEVLLEHFLREHRRGICTLLEEGMLAEDGYFAHLAPDVRRQRCEQYTEQVIQALLLGYMPRQAVQDDLQRLALQGVGPGDVLGQAAGVYRALEAYVRRELAADPALRDVVLTRLQQAYNSLVPKVTANLLEPPSRRLAPPPGAIPAPPPARPH